MARRTLNISLSDRSKKAITAMANEENRSISRHIEVLIARELMRLGEDFEKRHDLQENQ